jgi:hypothetical protein
VGGRARPGAGKAHRSRDRKRGMSSVCHPYPTFWHEALSLRRMVTDRHLICAAQPYRRAFGATSRVPDQFRPALTVDVCDSPAVGADSPISLGSTWPSRPVLGVSSKM